MLRGPNPQHLTPQPACSAEGLSLAALVTEVSCYAAAVAYGTRSGYLPTVWGSDLACHAQDSLVIATIAVLRKLPVLQTSVLVAAWLALQATLFTPVIPLAILAKFQVRMRPVCALPIAARSDAAALSPAGACCA